DARREDQRWLDLWRAQQLPGFDRIQALLAAATDHESRGERNGAIEAYRLVLEADPNKMAARFAIVRLLSELGDAQGALAALTELRDRTHGDVRAGLETRMGHVLADQLGRPEDALEMVAPVLESAPDDPTL